MEQYYLNSSEKFFEKNFEKRLKFIKDKKFLFSEISKFINNCINDSKEIFLFCAGNSVIANDIQSEKIKIKEINEKLCEQSEEKIIFTKTFDKKDIENCDHLVIADIEHQNNPTLNLLQLSNLMKDEARIIILSKNFLWMFILKFLNMLFNFSPSKNNFLPSSYLSNLYSSCNLEIVRSEKIIALPVNVPVLTGVINKIFRLPILNWFCILNVTILKKINTTINEEDQKISFIIPCKNEEKNIPLFKKYIKSLSGSYEFLFGDDVSTDQTLLEINKIKSELKNIEINSYEGPGICKSENVYKGIEISSGDIIIIYDADHTVSFDDIEFAIKILINSNADFINCTRMIYPQKDGAMKNLNFLGNSFFALLFSLLFKKKITDTLCGTKIFYKKDWLKIKKDVSGWGTKDLWGDYDLLIGAYKNNLKILEVPVTYYERTSGETKMTNVFKNALRMFYITIYAFYKLRLQK
tara:strand:+ start:177 stop:1577 length:1401 start_codon:yes stop_codon:yes gene_type:complete